LDFIVFDGPGEKGQSSALRSPFSVLQSSRSPDQALSADSAAATAASQFKRKIMKNYSIKIISRERTGQRGRKSAGALRQKT